MTILEHLCDHDHKHNLLHALKHTIKASACYKIIHTWFLYPKMNFLQRTLCEQSFSCAFMLPALWRNERLAEPHLEKPVTGTSDWAGFWSDCTTTEASCKHEQTEWTRRLIWTLITYQCAQNRFPSDENIWAAKPSCRFFDNITGCFLRPDIKRFCLTFTIGPDRIWFCLIQVPDFFLQ